MSKIGRKSIDTQGVQVEIKGQEVHYKGAKDSGTYILPAELSAKVEDGQLSIKGNKPEKAKSRVINSINRVWGLHRSLLANCIKGASVGFEKQLQITGLGYKAALSGNKLIFSLGYSHKIDYELPKGITVDIDKTGQSIKIKGSDKVTVGAVASDIRAMREVEPYKGTGIVFEGQVVHRKAGKTSK